MLVIPLLLYVEQYTTIASEYLCCLSDTTTERNQTSLTE